MKTITANNLTPGMVILDQFEVLAVECRLPTKHYKRSISVNVVSVIESIGYAKGQTARFEFGLSSKVAVSL